MVYVSCNPITFARDAAVLNRLHHFELKEVGVLNMFLHTHISNALVLLKDEAFLLDPFLK